MIHTVEATINKRGTVPSMPHRTLVTVLDEEPNSIEAALLSEMASAEDWNRPEEDAAWSHLQRYSS